MPATLVIRLVGLLLVSNQILPDGGFGAIAPKIPCPTRIVQHKGELTAEEAMNAVGVEEHVAMLLIRKKDYLANVGWEPAQLETKPGYYFVKLDGEQIRFLTPGGKSQRGSTRLLRSRVSTESQAMPDIELGVPHIEETCCADPTLRPEYLFPTYRLDAAVFDFSNGSPRACALKGGRIDTLVDIDNEGTVIIEATTKKGKKSITVLGTAQLVATNLPTDSMTGTRTCTTAHHAHNMAYSAMLLPCRRTVPCPKRTARLESCDAFDARTINPTRAIPQMPPEVYSRTDAQCSNTQWP
jgi:hypothetical protein